MSSEIKDRIFISLANPIFDGMLGYTHPCGIPALDKFSGKDCMHMTPCWIWREEVTSPPTPTIHHHQPYYLIDLGNILSLAVVVVMELKSNLISYIHNSFDLHLFSTAT